MPTQLLHPQLRLQFFRRRKLGGGVLTRRSKSIISISNVDNLIPISRIYIIRYILSFCDFINIFTIYCCFFSRLTKKPFVFYIYMPNIYCPIRPLIQSMQWVSQSLLRSLWRLRSPDILAKPRFVAHAMEMLCVQEVLLFLCGLTRLKLKILLQSLNLI